MPRPVEHQVTFPEGLTGAQIAAILNAAPDATGHVAATARRRGVAADL